MSNVTASGKPLATAAAEPASTPPAGPESSRLTGKRAACSTSVSPPAEVMIPTASAAPARPDR